jgi:hypothetical protein
MVMGDIITLRILFRSEIIAWWANIIGYEEFRVVGGAG